VLAERAGEVTRCDAGELGWAAHRLGAGRTRAGEAVHFGVGLILHAKRGDQVQTGQPLVTIRHSGGRGLDEALRRIEQAYEIL
jgi:thymidine phosphorylase